VCAPLGAASLLLLLPLLLVHGRVERLDTLHRPLRPLRRLREQRRPATEYQRRREGHVEAEERGGRGGRQTVGVPPAVRMHVGAAEQRTEAACAALRSERDGGVPVRWDGVRGGERGWDGMGARSTDWCVLAWGPMGGEGDGCVLSGGEPWGREGVGSHGG
jgi:hypothetical protein